MLELVLSVFILSVLSGLARNMHDLNDSAYLIFPDQYERIQTEAVLTSLPAEYSDDSSMQYPTIRFNENGNVNQARTITFPRNGENREIVIELGSGKLVLR